VREQTSDRPLSFGRYTFRAASGELRRGPRRLKLTPKAAAVLAALLSRPGQLLTKDGLFEAVWPDVAVSDAALTSCIQELRDVLRDDARRPRYIETVHRRGYRFVAPVPDAPGPGPDLPRAHDHVVGRERALGALRACLERARSGLRQTVLVAGEPGIGKTTTVEALLAGAAREGLLVGTGRCIDHHRGGEAYLPLLEALTGLGRAPDCRLVPVFRRHAPTWLAQMPSVVEPAELRTLRRTTAGATRERMLRELAEAVEALTETTPIALWLEDLHWSDVSTLDWLAYVTRRPGAARLLVIGTHRPVDPAPGRHPLPAVLQELALQERAHEIRLELLDEAAVTQYLVRRFGPAADADETGRLAALARLIHRRTEGNPLFMASAVQDLVGRGVLAQREGMWRLTERPETLEVTIPENVRAVIALQFGRLAEEERRLLEVASVVGLELASAAVAAGAGADPGEVGARCAALAGPAGFLVGRGAETWPDGTVTERYGFRHWLHHQIVYEHVPAGRRAELHRRIGERLAAAHGERADEIAGELAAQFERGGDARRAVHHLHRAAMVATRRGAAREAQAHLARALDLLRALPPSDESLQQEVAVQIALAGSLMATRGWGAPEVEGPLARAQALAERLDDAPRSFPALWGLWLFRWGRSELARAEELGGQLSARAKRSPDPALALQAHHALWATRLIQGAPTAALAHARHGTALYEPRHAALAAEYGNHDPGVCAHVMAAWTLELLGEPDEAAAAGRAALDLAAELRHPFTESLALVFAAHRHRFRGDADAVLGHARRATTLAREQGFGLFLAWAATMHGWALAETGRTEDGVAEMRQAIAAARAAGSRQLQTYLLATLAAGLLRAGEAAAALGVVTEALALVPVTGERFLEAELLRLEGEIRGVVGPTTEPGARAPRDCFLAALDVARRQGARELERRAAASLEADRRASPARS
jgi:DNA-binding winged helix-turn-helix (wHTH) protein/tetratricopeptide (TPR) repeat protein